LVDSDNENRTVDQLSKKLTEYKEGLTFEVSTEIEGKKEFIISADGLEELFPYVQKLMTSSPDLQNWKFIAFRPKMQDYTNFKLDYAEMEFDPEKIWVKPIIDDGNFDLILYLPNFNEENKNILISGSYILLDMALGEYDVVTGIRYLDHQILPENPEQEGLLPFSELRKIFDAYKVEQNGSATH
jgi:hypothetical protein